MASDWVKIRVSLPRDPKLIRMADFLAADPEFNTWGEPVTRVTTPVTRRVTRAICVTALLEIWGMARDRGKRRDDDLIVTDCTFDTLDEVSGVPGIGRSMESVRWAVSDGTTMVFPRYFVVDDAPDVRFRTPAAERQFRYRERKKESVTGHNDGITRVTSRVTPREEESREENSIREREGNAPKSPRFKPQDLDTIYHAYPRKVGPGQAKNAIQRALVKLIGHQDDPVLFLLDRVETFAKSPAGNAGQYTPHPTTWFNGERYNDDPNEWKKESHNGNGTHRQIPANDPNARRAAQRAEQYDEQLELPPSLLARPNETPRL